jgi:hypothetical protein
VLFVQNETDLPSASNTSQWQNRQLQDNKKAFMLQVNGGETFAGRKGAGIKRQLFLLNQDSISTAIIHKICPP